MAEEPKPKTWIPEQGRVRDLLVAGGSVAAMLLVPLVDRISGGLLDAVADRLYERLKPHLAPATTTPPKQDTPKQEPPRAEAPKPEPAKPAPAQPAPASPAPLAPAPAPTLPKPISIDIIDPARAAVQIHSEGSGCSGTLVRLDASEQYWLLTCAHCVRRNGQRVDIRGDNFQLQGVVERANRAHDICLVRVNEQSRKYPVAKIAETPPARGAALWHKGYGMDRPGNVERGTVLRPGDSAWACWYTTRLSSGDSGSGQFTEATGELVALGAWAGRGENGGASLLQIRAFLFPLGGSSPSPAPAPAWPAPQPGCPDGNCPPWPRYVEPTKLPDYETWLQSGWLQID